MYVILDYDKRQSVGRSGKDAAHQKEQRTVSEHRQDAGQCHAVRACTGAGSKSGSGSAFRRDGGQAFPDSL